MKIRMRIFQKLRFVLFGLVITLSTVNAQKVTISGYLTDAVSGETLISASVYDKAHQKGAVTNQYGFYSLTLPQGKIRLSFSYVGYDTQLLHLDLSQDTTLNIKMEGSKELDEVVVIGKRNDLGVESSQMSAIEIPIENIKKVPTLFGENDLIKALQLLPGVQSGTEGSAGMYVRGGGPDENLLLMDGIPVYNVNHLFGFFSVFNTDAVKKVTLYKGSFPARYGERLSSIVDIRMKDGDDKKYHGNVSIGLISSKFNVEGPIWKEHTTFNVSLRRTYIDLLARPMIAIMSKDNGNRNSSGGYYFYDVNAKITHKLNQNNRLFLSYYLGDDVVYFRNKNKYENENDLHTDETKLNWNWGNQITALRWNTILSNKLFLNTTVAYTRYRFGMKVGSESKTTARNNKSNIKQSSKIAVGYSSMIDDLSGRLDLEYHPNSNNAVKVGTHYTHHTFRPGVSASKIKFTSSEATFTNDTTYGDLPMAAEELVVYAEDNLSLGRWFKGNLGLHYSLFNVQSRTYQSVEPRLSMRFLVNKNLSLKAGYALMSQYIHLLSNSNISLPSDMWVPVTKRIVPMKSIQYSVGAFYNLLDLLDLSLEGYYKEMDNLIAYKDGASFLGQTTGWEDKVALGRGWAYGVEFLAQKNFGKTTGWIGYAWAKTERKFDRKGEVINQGRVFPAKYDRRHDFSITASHKFSEKIDVSVSWVYSTGNTGTLALQDYAEMSNNGVDNINTPYASSVKYVNSRNNYRFEDYHRLDLGVNFHKKKKHGIRTWNISVYNAYSQLNPFVALPKEDYINGKRVKKFIQYSLFPIIPSVSYSYQF